MLDLIADRKSGYKVSGENVAVQMTADQEDRIKRASQAALRKKQK